MATPFTRREDHPGEGLQRVQRGVERLPRRRGTDDDRGRLQHAGAGRFQQRREALGLGGRARHHDRAAIERTLVVHRYPSHYRVDVPIGLSGAMSAAPRREQGVGQLAAQPRPPRRRAPPPPLAVPDGRPRQQRSPSSRTVTPSSRAWAAIGVLQEAPSRARKARSATAQIRVAPSSMRAARASVAASSARASTARIPCPTAGTNSSGSSALDVLGAQPQPPQPGGGEHDSVEVAGAELAQPRVDVAADRLHAQVGPAARAAALAGAGSRSPRGPPSRAWPPSPARARPARRAGPRGAGTPPA